MPTTLWYTSEANTKEYTIEEGVYIACGDAQQTMELTGGLLTLLNSKGLLTTKEICQLFGPKWSDGPGKLVPAHTSYIGKADGG